MEKVGRSGRCHIEGLSSSRERHKGGGRQRSHYEGFLEDTCHCEGQEVWCQGSGGELKVGSPAFLRAKACGCLGILGGCQGSDAGITQAKVSSTLQLQKAGGCHMFLSRLLTWSQSLLPDGSSANGFQVCPWAPRGDILEDTPSNPSPTALVTFSHRTSAGLGRLQSTGTASLQVQRVSEVALFLSLIGC